MERKIFVYENFSSLEPKKLGVLYVDTLRGIEHYSFEYDQDWLKQSKFSFCLDPDISMFSGRQYTEKNIFGMFADASPDRWGRILMKRREAIKARSENRKPNKMYDSDFLLGVYDQTRVGALRFKDDVNGPFLSDDKETAAPPWATLRSLEEASRQFEKDDNYLNDVQYWLNKDVLFEKIPYLIAQSLIGDYDEGNSYNWAQWKNFNSDMILGLYIRKPSIDEMKPETYYKDLLSQNLEILTARIKEHPETQFLIFVPPYSMIWWDNLYRDGDTDAYLYNMQTAYETLLSYENVTLYSFQNDREIITNLENYMDTLHFSPEINHLMCDSLIEGTHRITRENYLSEIEDMRSLADEIVTTLIKPYEDRIKVDIYDE